MLENNWIDQQKSNTKHFHKDQLINIISNAKQLYHFHLFKIIVTIFKNFILHQQNVYLKKRYQVLAFYNYNVIHTVMNETKLNLSEDMQLRRHLLIV